MAQSHITRWAYAVRRGGDILRFAVSLVSAGITAGAAAAERSPDWQVELRRENGAHQLFIYLGAEDKPGPIIDLYEDLKRLRSWPTQIVLADTAELAARRSAASGPWTRYWDQSD